MYIDVERGLIGWLAERFPAARLCAELPNTLTGDTIQVVQYGGRADDVPFADALVDVDYYALTRLGSRQGAEAVRHALMYELPGQELGGGILLSVSNISAPSWAPHDNTSVRRTTAAYSVRTHNPI
jgi:hypothetical protein